MRRAVYVTCIRKGSKAYIISVRKPERKRPLEGPRNRQGKSVPLQAQGAQRVPGS